MLKKWLKKRTKGGSKHGEEAAETTAASPSTTTSRKNSGKKQTKPKISLSSKNKTKSPGRKSKYTNIEKEESRLSHSQPIVKSIVDEVQPVPPSSPNNEPSKSTQQITLIPPPRIHTASEGPKRNFKEVPLIRIRPIQGPPERPATVRPNSVEPEDESLPPDTDQQAPPFTPPSERLIRELSSLDVASPPSIDTALFAYLENGKGEQLDAGRGSIESDRGKPPTVIQAILPVNAGSESKGSVRSRSTSDLGTLRPYRDDEFFTATSSQSGTGTKRLQLWLEEVKLSIDAQRYPKEYPLNPDRYYVEGELLEEEKSNKDIDHTEALKESQNIIEKSLRESIERSKSQTISVPKGILKIKTVESGTIKEEAELTESSSGGAEQVFEGSDIVIGTEKHPIKVFSKSRRQRLQRYDSADDETSAATSHSSSGSEIVYETLRQLNPTVSRDDTQKSQNSMHLFYNRICNIGDMIEGYEDDLCRMDDISITDDTVTSRSTISKDSYMAHAGWMCFDSF